MLQAHLSILVKKYPKGFIIKRKKKGLWDNIRNASFHCVGGASLIDSRWQDEPQQRNKTQSKQTCAACHGQKACC